MLLYIYCRGFLGLLLRPDSLKDRRNVVVPHEQLSPKLGIQHVLAMAVVYERKGYQLCPVLPFLGCYVLEAIVIDVEVGL